MRKLHCWGKAPNIFESHFPLTHCCLWYCLSSVKHIKKWSRRYICSHRAHPVEVPCDENVIFIRWHLGFATGELEGAKRTQVKLHLKLKYWYWQFTPLTLFIRHFLSTSPFLKSGLLSFFSVPLMYQTYLCSVGGGVAPVLLWVFVLTAPHGGLTERSTKIKYSHSGCVNQWTKEINASNWNEREIQRIKLVIL